MDKKFLLTTLLLGSLITLTTTGCFNKMNDTSVMDEPAKMEQESAQPACEIQDEETEEVQEETTDKSDELLD